MIDAILLEPEGWKIIIAMACAISAIGITFAAFLLGMWR